MTSAACRWLNQSSGDELGEAIVWGVDWGDLGDRAPTIGDDRFLASLNAIDAFTQAILEVTDPDLEPRSSYIHIFSVATLESLTPDAEFGQIARPVQHADSIGTAWNSLEAC